MPTSEHVRPEVSAPNDFAFKERCHVGMFTAPSRNVEIMPTPNRIDAI